MLCPFCGSMRHSVTDSVRDKTGIYRRRKCFDCGKDFHSVEVANPEAKTAIYNIKQLNKLHNDRMRAKQ